MAGHESQTKYSSLIDLKLRHTLVKRDRNIFNTRYEGNPKAGSVKIPVRDTEVVVADYVKKTGATMTHGDTDYLTLNITKDKAVNELIDGWDAATVPDNLVADRLDSAAYSLALQVEQDATAVLEAQGTILSDTSALTKDSVYAAIVAARTQLSKNLIPNDGRRWLLVSPDVVGLILTSPEFTAASNLGDSVKQTGAFGKIAGFLVYEDNTLSETTDFIAGHPDWCTRVADWKEEVAINSLKGSGTYIGASAVQGRYIYDHMVTKAVAVLIKKNAADSGDDDT